MIRRLPDTPLTHTPLRRRSLWGRLLVAALTAATCLHLPVSPASAQNIDTAPTDRGPRCMSEALGEVFGANQQLQDNLFAAVNGALTRTGRVDPVARAPSSAMDDLMAMDSTNLGNTWQDATNDEREAFRKATRDCVDSHVSVTRAATNCLAGVAGTYLDDDRLTPSAILGAYDKSQLHGLVRVASQAGLTAGFTDRDMDTVMSRVLTGSWAAEAAKPAFARDVRYCLRRAGFSSGQPIDATGDCWADSLSEDLRIVEGELLNEVAYTGYDMLFVRNKNAADPADRDQGGWKREGADRFVRGVPEPFSFSMGLGSYVFETRDRVSGEISSGRVELTMSHGPSLDPRGTYRNCIFDYEIESDGSWSYNGDDVVWYRSTTGTADSWSRLTTAQLQPLDLPAGDYFFETRDGPGPDGITSGPIELHIP